MSRRPRRGLGYGLVRVSGASMRPTLYDGDLLLVRAARTARPGALVIVDLPGDRPRSVKRLIRREPDGWWVERDNPASGVDSWSLGAVPADGLHGVVVARMWPPRLRSPRLATGRRLPGGGGGQSP